MEFRTIGGCAVPEFAVHVCKTCTGGGLTGKGAQADQEGTGCC